MDFLKIFGNYCVNYLHVCSYMYVHENHKIMYMYRIMHEIVLFQYTVPVFCTLFQSCLDLITKPNVLMFQIYFTYIVVKCWLITIHVTKAFTCGMEFTVWMITSQSSCKVMDTLLILSQPNDNLIQTSQLYKVVTMFGYNWSFISFLHLEFLAINVQFVFITLWLISF